MKMPPVDNTPHLETGAFKLLSCLKASNKIPIFEYQSTKTGLTVIIAETEGPVVNGYFCLLTEAFDDDGLPHTLEHLIFLGSEEYPYKGILDLLANRSLASGTNAWTDTDHTCYTMETAGSEGFLSLMPIFLEHILYPILSEEAFVTEVHHITLEGDDAGVVYCEMQGCENTAESRLHLNFARAMYPGNCGYSSETGGIMKNLRESTTNAKVRSYHKEFYRPENLKVIITGKVVHEEVFKALESFEAKIIAKGDRGPFSKPWQSVVSPLVESKDLVIKYPADEEDNGLYCIGWRGPSAVNEQYLMTAIGILLKYLTEFSSYTLPKEFVEIDDPYASNVSYHVIENSRSCFSLNFEDVPLEKLPEIKPRLLKLFNKIIEEEDVNMERIQGVIKRSKLEYLSSIETTPSNLLAFGIIGYILYGNTKQDLQQRLDPVTDLSKLQAEPKAFWLELLKTYVQNANYISIESVPSKEEHATMAENERNRVKKQIEQLGETGLKKRQEVLENAVKVNSKDAPKEVLTSVPIPSLKKINFHQIERYNCETKNDKIDLSKSRVYTRFDHLKTEFVFINAILDSSGVPEDLRVYLPLLIESLFESPIVRNGVEIPYEQIIEELNNDTVSFGSSIGLVSKSLFKCGEYAQNISVKIQVEAGKFDKGIDWLNDVLFNTVFTADRLKIIATRMNNAIAQKKRSGRDVVSYAMRALRFSEHSNIAKNSIAVQSRFLSDVIETIAKPEVLPNIVKLWRILTDGNNIVLHIVGDLDLIKNPVERLEKFVPDSLRERYNTKSFDIVPDYKFLKKSQGGDGVTGSITMMGCIESSFFLQSVEGPTTYDHPDLPALMLYLQYLTQTEGPMWRQIRGKGYSYGYSMFASPNEGLLYLIFSRATNVSCAYQESREILENQLKTGDWDQNLLESAKSSLIFELIQREKTIGSVISLSVVSYFHQVDFDYNRKFLELVHNVTQEDLNRVGKKYLTRFFEREKVKTAIVCVPSKSNSIQETFKTYDIDLKIYSTVEESFSA